MYYYKHTIKKITNKIIACYIKCSTLEYGQKNFDSICRLGW